MKFNLRLISLCFLLLGSFFFFSTFTNASCFIDGVVNSTIAPINPDYDLSAICVNALEIDTSNVDISPGTTPYFISFRSPADSCLNYCGKVILFANATKSTVSTVAILNSSTAANWSLVSDGMVNQIHYNLTMQPMAQIAPPSFSSDPSTGIIFVSSSGFNNSKTSINASGKSSLLASNICPGLMI